MRLVRPACIPQGFTLAELLIALAILGVIATFTIPKVLQAQQDERWNAAAKEAAASISSAYSLYKLQNGMNPNMKSIDLIPYLNYIKQDITSTLDSAQTLTTRTCDSSHPCLFLHNGGVLFFEGNSFAGSAATNYVGFQFDPDGKVTDGTTNGPGKSLWFLLYFDAHLRTSGTVDPHSVSSTNPDANPNPAFDPPWFHWN